MTMTDEHPVSTAPYDVAFTVETNDLRQALSSVVVHADPKPDLTYQHRVRLVPGPENVTVFATDTHSAGLAIVSVIAHDAPELEAIDLTPTAVKEILGLFVGGRVADDDPEHLLRIEASETHVRITDVSGLFDGKSYTLLRTATDDNMPPIPKLLAAMIRREPGSTGAIAVNGTTLARFKAAARAYGQPLLIESAATDRSSLLLSCGQSFLGALMPIDLDPDQLGAIAEWRRAWEVRLPVGGVA